MKMPCYRMLFNSDDLAVPLGQFLDADNLPVMRRLGPVCCQPDGRRLHFVREISFFPSISYRGPSMRNQLLASAALLAAASLASQAQADTISFTFSGLGVLAQIQLTYSPSSPQGALDSQPNSNYPVGSYVVDHVSGTFSDTNTPTPIVNAVIDDVVPPTFETTEDPGNILAPHSFSRLPGPAGGQLTYDNVFYPNGNMSSVATGYDPFGGYFDIYGLAFSLVGSGVAVNLWNDGTPDGSGTGSSYGVAVQEPFNGTDPNVIDYVGGGVSVPEPGSFALFGSGLLGLLALRRRSTASV